MPGMMLISCDSSSESAFSTVGYDYFPLAKGSYQEYAVTEVVYTLGEPDTAEYTLKVSIADAFLNDEGDSTYVLYRSKRTAKETSWAYLDTWSVRRGDQEIILNEENTPYVKLRFPVRAGAQWDGNAYNIQGRQDYRLDSLGVTRTFGGEQFDDCLTVVQSDNEDFIVFLDQRREVYAHDIGLVYKKTTQLYYCTQPACLGDQVVERGVIYEQVITGRGHEE
jgi:hypothetical protein